MGLQYRNIKSYPVGFEQIINMYPMDFEEFLWANALPNETIDYLRDCFETRRTVSEPIHQQLLKTFYLYMIVGGMPEAVQTFVDTKDLAAVEAIQKKSCTSISPASRSIRLLPNRRRL